VKFKDALDYESSLNLHEIEGVKYDDGKTDWTLVPFKALEPVVKVLEYGARKYSRGNWQMVKDARRRYLAAAYRHMNAIVDGEWIDSESKEPHAAHVICCMLFIIWFNKVGKED